MGKKRVERSIEIREFDISSMRPNCKICCVGRPNSGKSSVMNYIMYYWKYLFSTVLVFNGTENETKFYEGPDPSNPKIPPLYIYDDFETYGEPIITEFVIRLKIIKNKMLSKEISENDGWSMLICDDISDNADIMKKKIFKTLMKMGRHWPMMFMIGMQYPADLSTQMRSAFDYVFIMECNEEKTLKSIFENYAGAFSNFRDFQDVMKQVAINYGALVIDNTIKTQSTDIGSRVFYFKPPFPIPNFKFGCSAYRIKSDEEYNKDYDPVDELLNPSAPPEKKKKKK